MHNAPRARDALPAHPALGRSSRFAVVGGDPVAIEVLEQLRAVLHADRVVVERRAVSHQELNIGVRGDVVESQQPLQNACHVELQRLLEGVSRAEAGGREGGVACTNIITRIA